MLVYLDTNFLVNAHKGKPDYAKCWTSLQHRVGNDGWRCMTSDFAVMEFVDVLQDNAYVLQQLARNELIGDIVQNRHRERVLERRRVKRVQDEVGSWLATNSTLFTIEDLSKYSTRDIFRLASVMCLNGPIMAPDAVHLTFALLLGCDVVLTGDELFGKTVSNHLARKGSAFRRLTFKHIEEITDAPIGTAELDEQGRILEALKVQDFLNRYPAPR